MHRKELAAKSRLTWVPAPAAQAAFWGAEKPKPKPHRLVRLLATPGRMDELRGVSAAVGGTEPSQPEGGSAAAAAFPQLEGEEESSASSSSSAAACAPGADATAIDTEFEPSSPEGGSAPSAQQQALPSFQQGPPLPWPCPRCGWWCPPRTWDCPRCGDVFCMMSCAPQTPAVNHDHGDNTVPGGGPR